MAAVQAATAQMNAGAKLIPSSVAVKGKFYGFTSWEAGAVVGGAPLLIVLLMLWFTGMFSRVPKADFEQLQVKQQQAQAFNEEVKKQGRYYLDLIRRYKEKKSKTTDFPAHERAK